MNKKELSITPGLMLMIMVFIILCMLAFASLYYIEAIRSNNSTNKSYEAISEYYEADSKMMEKINAYKQSIQEKENMYKNGDIINLEIDINNHEKLVVELSFFDNDFKINKYHKVVNNGMGY